MINGYEWLEMSWIYVPKQLANSSNVAPWRRRHSGVLWVRGWGPYSRECLEVHDHEEVGILFTPTSSVLALTLICSPDVELCGYSIPHPSEDKMNLRIQTYGSCIANQVDCKFPLTLSYRWHHGLRCIRERIRWPSGFVRCRDWQVHRCQRWFHR